MTADDDFSLPPEPKVSEAHPELHHYTDWEGLRGIWQSQTMWATDFREMNDPTEYVYALKFLVDALIPETRKILMKMKRKSLKVERAIHQVGSLHAAARHEAEAWVSSHYTALFQVTGLPGEPPVPFAVPHITCFCSHVGDKQYERENGLLSQWRGYGGRSAYALVFDTARLEELLQIELQKFAYFDASLHDVFYDRVDDDTRVRFDNIVSALAKGLAGTLGVGPKRSFSYLPLFQAVAGRLKHRGYHEEREVRLIVYPVQRAYRDVLAGRGLSSPRTEPLKQIIRAIGRPHLDLFGNDMKLPIKRIIVGPSTHRDNDEKMAQELTGGEVEIHVSETPYRQVRKNQEF